MKKLLKLFSFSLVLILMLSFTQVVVHAVTYNASDLVFNVNARLGSSYPNGLCLRWVAEQFLNTYGISVKGVNCCAKHFGDHTIESTDRNNIPIGAVVFFNGSSVTCNGAKAGHIGIHVGSGNIVHAFNWGGNGTKIYKDHITKIEGTGLYSYRGWGWYSDVELIDDSINFDIKKINTYPEFEGKINAYSGSGYAEGSYNILFVQKALQDLGYDIAADGLYGPSSTQVVKAFQQKYDLSGTGSIDKTTWNKIVSELKRKYQLEETDEPIDKPPVVEEKDEPIFINKPETYPTRTRDLGPYVSLPATVGSDVYFVQLALADFGYDIDTDASYGPATTSVVKLFQQKYNLSVTGKTDKATWNKIVELLLDKYDKKDEPVDKPPVIEEEKDRYEEGEEIEFDYIEIIDVKNSYIVIEFENYNMKLYYDDLTNIKVEGSKKKFDFDILEKGMEISGSFEYVSSKKGILLNAIISKDSYYDYVDTEEDKGYDEDYDDNGEDKWLDIPEIPEVTDKPPYLPDVPEWPEPEDYVPTINNPFIDVKEYDYFYKPVLWAYEKNITKGMSDNLFGPYENCTRGQAVTFLWRASGSPEPKTTVNSFLDVSPNDYFYKAVLWAVESGITAGTGNGYFSPDVKCSNAHIITFLWRSLGSPQNYNSEIWYQDALNWAYTEKILDGTYSGVFDPSLDAFRGNIVTYLFAYYK